MTEEEREAWEAALAIHKVAEELRKKKEAEEAARIAAGGEPVVQRIKPAAEFVRAPPKREEPPRDPPPPKTPHPDDAETKAEL